MYTYRNVFIMSRKVLEVGKSKNKRLHLTRVLLLCHHMAETITETRERGKETKLILL